MPKFDENVPSSPEGERWIASCYEVAMRLDDGLYRNQVIAGKSLRHFRIRRTTAVAAMRVRHFDGTLEIFRWYQFSHEFEHGFLKPAKIEEDRPEDKPKWMR